MTTTKYESIDKSRIHIWNADEQETPQPTTMGKRMATAVTVAAGVLVIIASFGISSRNGQPAASHPTLPMMMMSSEAGVRDCSFEECYATHCDWSTAPFTCLFHNGGPHGGCSPVEWTVDTCTEQCNLEICDSLPIPDTVASCDGVACSESWCEGGQVCGDDVPYQCTSGSARFGCSADELQWTLRTSADTCSECCDSTTC